MSKQTWWLIRGVALMCLCMASALVCAATVSVKVEQLSSDKGTVLGALCRKEEFLKSCKFKAAATARRSGTVLTFENVPPGKYAVSVFHDENDNKKLDSNFFGIPVEGIGFSQNASARFGPPDFDSAAFNVNDSAVDLTLALRY
jgi:uncharacterized protein (DUF2141 family)